MCTLWCNECEDFTPHPHGYCEPCSDTHLQAGNRNYGFSPDYKFPWEEEEKF